MATIEQMQQALINADKAGDTAAATALAQALKAARATATSPAPPPSGGLVGQGLSGVNEGIANIVGRPVDVINSALGGVGDLVNKGFGTNLQLASPEPVMGSAFWKKVMGSPMPGTDATMIRPPTTDPAEHFVRTAGQGVGEMAVAGPTLGVGILPSLVSGAGSGLGEAIGGGLSHDNPWVMAAGSLAGGGLASGVEQWLANRTAERAAMSSAPSVDQIFGAGRGKYGEAQTMGVTADQTATTGLRDSMRQIATERGIIGPTGKVNQSFPKINGVLGTMDEYAQGTMTPSQMQAVREVLTDAAGAGGKEGAAGTAMLRAFDQFTTSLAPQLREGDALFAQAYRAKDIQTAINLANDHAATGKTTLDRALRDEFGRLQDKITKGDLTGFTADQVAAIKDVAQTGILRGTARAIATAVPQSFGGLALKEGLPFFAGTQYGGTVGGLAAMGGTTALGYGGRAVADAIARRSAARASALARGAVLPPATSGAIPSVAAALFAAQATDPRRFVRPY